MKLVLLLEILNSGMGKAFPIVADTGAILPIYPENVHLC